MAFNKLRKRIAQRIQQLITLDIEPASAMRGTLPNGDTFTFDQIIGPALSDKEKLHVSRGGRHVHFPKEAVEFFRSSRDDALRQKKIAARVSEDSAFSTIVFGVFDRLEELKEGKATPTEVANAIVDELEDIDEAFTLFTPIHGCVPENGPITIGGVRISRSDQRFIDEVYSPGVARKVAKHKIKPRMFDTFEEEHLESYALHSVAQMECVGEADKATDDAIHRMDLVLGALRLFTVLAIVDIEQFQYRAFGDPWNSPPHYMKGWKEDHSIAPTYGLQVHNQPIALDTERIPVTKLPQFPLIDRVICAHDPDTELTELERRLRQFVYWFGLAQDSSRPAEKFVKFFVCLETLFDCPGVSKIDKTVFPALYWAWVDQNVAEGRKLRDDLVRLYKHRGKMVHEGVSAVTTEQLDRLQFGTVMGFFLFTDLLMNLEIASSAELRDWYLQHKAILEDDGTDQ